MRGKYKMPRYIDAEKLERFFKRDEWDTPDERWRQESEFGKFVDVLPTEDVVPTIVSKKDIKILQKWIDLYQQKMLRPLVHAKFIMGDEGFVRCSACGKTIRYPLVSFSDIEYCPRCGAKIDREKT